MRRPDDGAVTDDAQRAAVVAELNTRHGLSFRLDGRFADGLQGGAWKLVDSAGGKAVLKWAPGGNGFYRIATARAVDRLRQHGYPTPAWIAVGEGSYVLQGYVDGEPATLTRRFAELCVEVIEMQAGLAPRELDRDWSSYVYDEARSEDSSIRAYLRDLGASGRDLTAHFDRVLREHDPAVVTSLRAAAERAAAPAVLATCLTATALDIVRFVDLRWPDETLALISRMHDLADYLTG